MKSTLYFRQGSAVKVSRLHSQFNQLFVIFFEIHVLSLYHFNTVLPFYYRFTCCFISFYFLTACLSFCVRKITLLEHFSYLIVFMTIHRCILKPPQLISQHVRCYITTSCQQKIWQQLGWHRVSAKIEKFSADLWGDQAHNNDNK